jgi:NitT/TauT family transport system ATP-binding protein
MAAVTGALNVDIREKSFVGPRGARRVILGAIGFRVAHGEVVAVVGPSGIGKTTLLNILAGIEADFAGKVQLNGGRVGYVFQEPRLLPWRTVRENVALVLPRGHAPEIVDHLLEQVGLADVAATYPQRLSLGMARRVALARALAVEPELLLLDEPFASLDTATAERLYRLLLSLWRARSFAVVLVTHDLHEAVRLADRILVIGDTPSRLVADIAVPLTRDRRDDSTTIAQIAGEIAAGQPAAVTAATSGTR